MNVSLYQAAAGLDTNSRWQEVVADNLASSSMSGYKRKELSMEAAQAGLMAGSSANSSGGQQSFIIPRSGTNTNFETGAMKETGVDTDVAIDGKGFFSVQLPNGVSGYTRDGEFHVDSAGQLVSKEGYQVLGAGGPILLDRKKPESVSISATGQVTQGKQVKGKLQVTDFDKPNLLTQAVGSYFVANDSKIKAQPSTATLRPKYVEGSNVSTVHEMVNLLTAMRGFEANQKLIQMEDERMGKMISDVGNPT